VCAQVLVFVNSADSGMRVRLFLEAFGIRAAVLSADQPLNSRHHILQVRASLCGAVHVLLLCMKTVNTSVGIAGR
jgi:superfamily II DNA/RNA helicase